MKRIIFILFLLAAPAAFAQVKVGDNPTNVNSNAVLEAESANKGVLLPRVALTATDSPAPLSAFSAGMTVYNTATAGSGTTAVTPGLYYCDGTKWVSTNAATAAATSEPWYKVGSTTGATANTDDVYLNGKVGIGTNTPGDKLDVAGNLTVRGSSIAGGNKNISIKNDAGTDRWAMGMGVAESGSGNTGGNFYLWNYGDNGAFLGNPLVIERATGNIGINNGAPNASAILDIASTNKGVLLPRVALTATNSAAPLSAFSAGMTVYNTATAGSGSTAVTPGLYYCDGAKWVSTNATTAAATSEPWYKVGTTTGASANTDDVYLNGKVGVGTSSPQSKLHISGDAASSFKNSAIFSTNTGTGGHTWSFGARPAQTAGDFTIADETDAQVRMTIQGVSGNVGIGTGSPLQKLDVAGNLALRNSAVNGGTKNISIQSSAGLDRWAIGIGVAESGSANSGGNFYIWNYADNGTFLGNPFIIERSTGYIGINNGSPKAPLHIGGTTSSSFSTGAYTYFNGAFANGSGVSAGPASGPRSDASLITEGNIFVKGAIHAVTSLTYSDRRIKNVIGQSDASKDLDLLNKLRVTDYRMKDVVKHGNQQYKKVIAQEVEEIYPEAVTQQTGFVPNIYQLADNIQSMGNNTYKASFKNKVEYNKNVTGDLMLYDEHKEITAKVVSKGDNEIVFTTTDAVNGDKLFLFGEEVTDFRAVDYEALSTLNISATQELYREIQALKKQNAALTASIEDTKTAYAELASQVKAMQQVLNMPTIQDGTVADRK